MQKSSAYIVSNDIFKVPEDCKVDVEIKAAGYHGWGSSTMKLYVYSTSSAAVTSGDYFTVKGNQYYPNQAQWETYTKTCTLTTNANDISIYGSISSSGISGFTQSIMLEDIWVNYNIEL